MEQSQEIADARNMGKYPKAAVHYGPSPNPRAHSCGICDHFLNPDSCAIVRGAIRVNDGCKLYTPEIIPCEAK